MRISIGRSRAGHPTLWVGGAATRNGVQGRFVLDSHLRLKRAIFVVTHFKVQKTLEQAVVVVEKGDYIVGVSGGLPVERGNPKLLVEVRRVTGISSTNEADLELATLPIDWWLPEKVIQGLSTPDNCRGTFFCEPPHGKGERAA